MSKPNETENFGDLNSALKAIGLDVIVVGSKSESLMPKVTHNWEVEEFTFAGECRAYIEFDGKMSIETWTDFALWLDKMRDKVAVG